MPVTVRTNDAGMLRLKAQLHYLATHEVRVGVLTGDGKGGTVDGATAKAGEKLTGTALRDHKVRMLARRFERQDKNAPKRERAKKRRAKAARAKRREAKRAHAASPEGIRDRKIAALAAKFKRQDERDAAKKKAGK